MGLSFCDRNARVKEYRQAWATAEREKKDHPSWNEIDVFAFLTTRHADKRRRCILRSIVLIAAGLFLSEAERLGS